MLRELDENLWVAEQPLRFMGLEVGTRTTVVRLADGALWVHSPLRPTPELRKVVERLGPVRFLVAPNALHHLFIAEWMAAWPEARAYASPVLPKSARICASTACCPIRRRPSGRDSSRCCSGAARPRSARSSSPPREPHARAHG